MEDNGTQLAEKEALEADRARALEEKKARQEAAAKKKRRKVLRKRLIGLGITLAVCGGIAFGLYKLFHEEEPQKTVWSDYVTRGSISSMVTGTGSTKARSAKTLTLASGGVVRDVFVTAGDYVEEGQPLYNVDSTEAEKAVKDAQQSVEDAHKGIESAQKSVQDYEKQLGNLSRSYEDLTVTAPFTGKMLEAENIQTGDRIGSGQRLGTLADDSVMKLTLYFSYAFENDVTQGKTVEVSIPATMQTLSGTVSEVNKLRRITPEGSSLFEAVVTVANPGTLTAGMGATATLIAADGEEVYPYEPGELDYSRSQEIEAKAGGDVLIADLHSYAQVTAGQTLLQIKADDLSDETDAINSNISNAKDSVRRAEETLANAEETLEKAKKALEDYHAAAPMSGTVISCSLVPGETCEAGRTAVTIADTSVMLVDIQIDSMNIMYVEAGMPCDLTMYGSEGEQYFYGTVDTVSMEGKNENGYNYFPATVLVENPDGLMKPGMPVDYSMVASQSDDCLLVPNQAVKQSAQGTCVFVKADTPPENALNPDELGLELPEGFHAVPVTVGLSDQTSAEIVEGVEEGQEVFVQYMTDSGDSWSGGMGGVAVAVG